MFEAISIKCLCGKTETAKICNNSELPNPEFVSVPNGWFMQIINMGLQLVSLCYFCSKECISLKLENDAAIDKKLLESEQKEEKIQSLANSLQFRRWRIINE